MGQILETYLATIPTPMKRGKVRRALEMQMTLNRANCQSRADHAVSLYGRGYRLNEAKGRLCSPNGSFFCQSDLTKALFDFFRYLETTNPL